jgi:LysM repeat protein
MNDKFTNNLDEEAIARKLNQVAEQTQANGQFAADLEEQLRSAHRSKANWFASVVPFSPTLRWVTLMVLLVVVLSWSIKTLIPAPQPAINATPVASAVPTSTTSPDIPSEESNTPVPQESGFDYRDAKLFLQRPLPDSPASAHVYVLNKEHQPATLEQARTLADRFGIQGEVYTEPNYIFNTTNYVFSDGKQALSVYSDRSFIYLSDLTQTNYISTNTPNDNAEVIIREFLQTRGFDFPYRIFLSDFFTGYIVQPLAPDSIPMQFESFTPPSMTVMLDANGDVLRVDASLMSYDPTPVGEYGIISAQEAFDKLLNDNVLVGKMEFVHSAEQPMQDWYRSYPDNQPVTVYGHISVYPSADGGTPALVLVDGVPVIGNTTGMEALERYTFVQVNGQYIVENDIRKLNVESWDRKVVETSLTGSWSQQGDQIILTSNNGSAEEYALIDPPADLPLDRQSNTSVFDVYGVIVDGRIFWTFIRLFEDYSSGGGGGGSGLGFYKLNLSGPPVPFPTPTPLPVTSPQTYVVEANDTAGSIAAKFGVSIVALSQANNLDSSNTIFVGQTLVIPSSQSTNFLPTGFYTIQEGDTLSAISQNFGTTVDELIRLNHLSDTNIYVGQVLSVPFAETTEQAVEEMRGYLSVSIHNKSDGTSFKEYTLEVTLDNGGAIIYTLDGAMLSEVDAYNGLPILVSGSINSTGKLLVESYAIPYPELHFQVLKGTQQAAQVGGQNVITFTTEDGVTYVEFLVTNPFPLTPDSFTGEPGDLIQQEVLNIPDETFGGLPVAHVYQSAIVQEGSPEMEVQANRIYTINEPDNPMSSPDYAPPNLTINQVELVYFVSNPYYQVNDPNYQQRSPYIQPVWHFQGRYDDGTEFDALIQALKQEFLLPELEPHVGLG